METYIERIRWDNIKKYGSKVVMIDIDQPNGTKELHEVDREELLVANKYIEHSSNNYGPDGLVNIYDIVDRAIDNRGNLILFVQNNAVSYTR